MPLRGSSVDLRRHGGEAAERQTILSSKTFVCFSWRPGMPVRAAYESRADTVGSHQPTRPSY